MRQYYANVCMNGIYKLFRIPVVSLTKISNVKISTYHSAMGDYPASQFATSEMTAATVRRYFC